VNWEEVYYGGYEMAPARAPYDREKWPHWIDEDGDCQDTRAEILIRDNVGELKFKRNKPCNVSWGKWVCPYTGKVITKASGVDVDHIVPLAWANEHSGYLWSSCLKQYFANDPENLLVVDDTINKKKGDKGPDKWMPPRKEFWAEYLARWREITRKYGLHVWSSEEEAIQQKEAAVGVCSETSTIPIFFPGDQDDLPYRF
jgi:hypothetical protein